LKALAAPAERRALEMLRHPASELAAVIACPCARGVRKEAAGDVRESSCAVNHLCRARCAGASMRAAGLHRWLGVPLALARLARVLLRARHEPPQCVLVLGGCKERELAAARMFGAAAVPSARMLLISSGAASLSELQAAAAPAAAHTVLVDRRAVDTVTNFTTVARSLAAAGVTSVACATARKHCWRALAVGTLVLGAEGECLCGSNV